MKTITFTELRTFIGKYLSKAKSGDTFMITERGRPIAKIVPIRGFEMKRSGHANRGKAQLPPDFWTLPRPKDPEGLALQYLLSERHVGR